MQNASLIVMVIKNALDNVPEIMHFVLKPVHATRNATADVPVRTRPNIVNLVRRNIKKSITFVVI